MSRTLAIEKENRRRRRQKKQVIIQEIKAIDEKNLKEKKEQKKRNEEKRSARGGISKDASRHDGACHARLSGGTACMCICKCISRACSLRRFAADRRIPGFRAHPRNRHGPAPLRLRLLRLRQRARQRRLPLQARKSPGWLRVPQLFPAVGQFSGQVPLADCRRREQGRGHCHRPRRGGGHVDLCARPSRRDKFFTGKRWLAGHVPDQG